MTSPNMDASGMRSLSADLRSAPSKLAPQVNAVIFKGAMNIKAAMQSDMSASRHFKGTTPSIDFDMIDAANSVTAEIGPKTGSGESGGLAGIAYGTGVFGGSRGGGSVRDPIAALDDEAPKVEKFLGDVLEGLL